MWPSRLLNSTGNSIILNGAGNRKFGQVWYLNLGFNHLQFNAAKKKIKYRILPMAFAGTIEGFFRGRLDLLKTLKTGVFIFESKEKFWDANAHVQINSIVYFEGLSEDELYQILAHEMIHIYQYEGLFGLNAYFDNQMESLGRKSKFIKGYNTIFYTDFNQIPLQLNHEYNSLFDVPYSKRFVEKEAIYFQGK